MFDVVGWAYHRRAKALQKYAPVDFDVTLGSRKSTVPHECDLFLVLDCPTVKRIRRLRDAGKVNGTIVGSYNRGNIEGVGEYCLSILAAHADCFVVANSDIYEQVKERSDRSVVVYSGVDLDLFNVTTSLSHRPFKVLWTGSVHHREIKNYDSIVVPVGEALERADVGFDFDLVDSLNPRRTARQMADWYNSGTVYLVASTAEGIPNTGLEASACGCYVVTTWVGSMTSFVAEGKNGCFVEPDVHSVLYGIARARLEYLQCEVSIQTVATEWSWERRSADFYELFRTVIDKAKRANT